MPNHIHCACFAPLSRRRKSGTNHIPCTDPASLSCFQVIYKYQGDAEQAPCATSQPRTAPSRSRLLYCRRRCHHHHHHVLLQFIVINALRFLLFADCRRGPPPPLLLLSQLVRVGLLFLLLQFIRGGLLFLLLQFIVSLSLASSSSPSSSSSSSSSPSIPSTTTTTITTFCSLSLTPPFSS